MKFLDSFNISLNEFHLKKLQCIDNFDYSATLKKVNHDLGGVSKKYLEMGLENLKRYYAVALLDPNNEHAVSAPVDPFWHSHILHTKDYFQFTQNIYSQYIHHEPLDKDNPNEVKDLKKLYEYTLNVYSEIFKTIDENWWPKAEKGSAVGPVVCRHMFVNDEEIKKFSLFDLRQDLKPVRHCAHSH